MRRAAIGMALPAPLCAVAGARFDYINLDGRGLGRAVTANRGWTEIDLMQMDVARVGDNCFPCCDRKPEMTCSLGLASLLSSRS